MAKWPTCTNYLRSGSASHKLQWASQRAGAEEMFLSAPWFKVHSSPTVIHATFAFNIHTTQHSLLWDLKREKLSKNYYYYYYLISFIFSDSMLILAKLNNSLLFALETGFEYISVYSFILLYCPYRHPGGWWTFSIELICCFFSMP